MDNNYHETPPCHRRSRALRNLAFSIFLGAAAAACFADRVELVNGDQYSGTVLSVNLTNVTLRSDVQGAITLPRASVVRITFGEHAAAAPVINGQTAPLLQGSQAIAPQKRSGELQSKAADTNVVAQIQGDLLSQAGPEATRKYNELARGLLSGSLSIAELRKQAQQTIKDTEAMREDLGPEAGEVLDGYLEILRRFVEQSAAAPAK